MPLTQPSDLRFNVNQKIKPVEKARPSKSHHISQESINLPYQTQVESTKNQLQRFVAEKNKERGQTGNGISGAELIKPPQ